MKGFKKGDRIKMIQMSDDPNPILPGETGTITDINIFDDHGREGQLGVKWDNGRTLSVLIPQDIICKI